MPEDQGGLRYWIVGERWSDGWFLPSLLAGLLLGLPGLLGALTSYFVLRAAGTRLPRFLSAAAALAVAILIIILSEALLEPR